MSPRPRTWRMTWAQLLVLVAASTVATVILITSATRRTAAQNAALALLARAPLVRRVAPVVTPAAPAGIGSDPLLSAGPARPTPTAVVPAPSVSSSPAPAPAATTTTPSAAPTGTVKHVFVIALTTTGYAAAFGRGSVARYLNSTLRKRGTLLSGYHSLDGAELPDFLAMVSGQPPNSATRANCSSYDDFGAGANPNAAGLIRGAGCVYPNTVTTVGDQVTGAGAPWRAYIAGMGKQSCVHPNSAAADDVVLPFAGDQYATRHNPFIYFHSVLDLGDCSADDVDLSRLGTDLHAAARTPRYSFIAPPLCDDASASGCPARRPGGLAGEDVFLKRWVPRIIASPAYRQAGVLMIVFAPSRGTASTGPTATTATTTPATPVTTAPPTTTVPYAISPATSPVSVPPRGGGEAVRTGALIMSRYGIAGHTVVGDYDPYSVLRSIEDLLGFQALGQAKRARSFVNQALPGTKATE